MRRVLFPCVLVLVAYLCVEVGAFGAWWLINGAPFSFSAAGEERRRRETFEERVRVPERTVWHELRRKTFVPHPFLGAIHDPEQESFYWWIPNLRAGPLDPADTTNVVITGGSVAWNFARREEAWPVVEEALAGLPPFRDKRIQLVNLAYRSHKQPQQLMAVSYFLALGGRIDLLINIDGFNEVGLELHGNVRYGIFPAYPFTWVPLTKGLESQAQLESLGNIYAYRGLRARLAGAMDLVGFSVAANLLWQALDRYLAGGEQRAMESHLDVGELPLFSRGPPFAGGEEEAYALGVEVWSNASLSLRHLAEGRGFAYFHFLQPNQYLDGSKPFTVREERRFRSRSLLRRLIPRWYPVLMERGAGLREKGVRFHDLTGIYREVEAGVYRDSCCHVGGNGNRIMAEEIAGVLRRYYTARSERGG